jgi:hypothetical protein
MRRGISHRFGRKTPIRRGRSSKIHKKALAPLSRSRVRVFRPYMEGRGNPGPPASGSEAREEEIETGRVQGFGNADLLLRMLRSRMQPRSDKGRSVFCINLWHGRTRTCNQTVIDSVMLLEKSCPSSH